MANIKSKNINDLGDWNLKELRKLKIMIKNRINALISSPKKEVAQSHPLFNKDIDECQDVLSRVLKAEKNLLK